MNTDYLDFEKPIAELEQKIEELHRVEVTGEVNLIEEVTKLKDKSAELTRAIFSKLTPQQVVQLARHPSRPHSIDYIEGVFTDFHELHGDRHSGQGKALVAGLARFNGRSVMVIGQEKGRSTKEKVERNFGMLKPEGFRRALRLMKLAEKFDIPVITFIDTPGAYPGVRAEEQNQSEAIARNLYEMSMLRVPILTIVIGEGCSGGALGIGVGDRNLMLQYSYYSVISPEGCASILWKSASMAGEAAQAMGLTSDRLKSLDLIDDVVDEPLGGAHRDEKAMMATMHSVIKDNLAYLDKFTIDELLQKRSDYWLSKGAS